MVKICNDAYPSNSKYDSHFELYPYPLSDFQKYAIEAIVENLDINKSVFVDKTSKKGPKFFLLKRYYSITISTKSPFADSTSTILPNTPLSTICKIASISNSKFSS